MLDAGDGRVVAQVDTGEYIAGSGLNSAGNRLVAALTDDRLVEYEPRSGSVLATASIAELSDVEFSADDSKLYVCSTAGQTLHVLDARSLTALRTITFTGEPTNGTLTPDGRHLWARVDDPDRLEVVTPPQTR